MELRASRERLERMFRGSPLPIAISGIEDGAVIDVNDAWSRTYGYAREAILGRNFVELGLWTTPTPAAGCATSCSRAARCATSRLAGARPRARRPRCSFPANTIELDGEPVMLSAALDVTERNSAERRMRESEARFSKIFHSSPVPVVITGSPTAPSSR